MTINHHIDLVIKFIDSFTDKPLISAHDIFLLNGFPIKPTKKMEPYVIFTHIINNPHYGKSGDANRDHEMVWKHPYYESIALGITNEAEQLIRAIPNRNYPYPKEMTAIKGIAVESTLVELIHTHSRNRFLLKSSVIANKYVDIAQSYESELFGRKFLFSEEHHDQIVNLRADSIGIYSEPNLIFPYTEACEIYEIIESIPGPEGQFLMPLKNFKSTDRETLEFKMRIHVNSKVKSTLVKIKKDVINDVGKF
ncbi:hypothetical protein [Fusibacter sp. 3D3]|uniref:hypothetical protein n=1 Tax=Fusibacter sp. 3D3 TaxID=1048380 RepID=UPI0008532D63|nr:hypothetical protein [Fusibacter sp. 3D3]GAU77497.1 hypothetical protein F3D3_2126 [Fusibacter sp. 3D3]